MNPTIQKKIQEYRFEDAKQQIYAVIAGNVLLLLLMLFFPGFKFNLSPRSQILLFTSIVYGIAIIGYDWKFQPVNIFLIVFYVGVWAFELLALGLPDYIVDYTNYTISKGIMLDLFIWSLPAIYIGLRLVLVIPLLKIAMIQEY